MRFRGFSDLTFRPIDEWAGQLAAHRRRAPFRAPWGSTVALVTRELRMLDAESVVLMIAIAEHDLRLDGTPRAAARAEHPGVILAFGSKYGPLKYQTDEFTTWQENLRAIGLSMEALRKVDRYGVSKRGEQYRGWRALPSSTDAADSITTREQAVAYLAQWGGDVRAAVKATHPDQGGNPDEFRKVMRAKELTS